MGKGWGSVDVDTDWVVGEALGGVWGSVDVETECVAGCCLVEVALVAVAARGSIKGRKSRCRNRRRGRGSGTLHPYSGLGG